METVFQYCFRYVNFNLCISYIIYILGKCVQSYTYVKTVLLRAIPTVIRTYINYDQYYGSALFLLKITYPPAIQSKESRYLQSTGTDLTRYLPFVNLAVSLEQTYRQQGALKVSSPRSSPHRNIAQNLGQVQDETINDLSYYNCIINPGFSLISSVHFIILQVSWQTLFLQPPGQVAGTVRTQK